MMDDNLGISCFLGVYIVLGNGFLGDSIFSFSYFRKHWKEQVFFGSFFTV